MTRVGSGLRVMVLIAAYNYTCGALLIEVYSWTSRVRSCPSFPPNSPALGSGSLCCSETYSTKSSRLKIGVPSP